LPSNQQLPSFTEEKGLEAEGYRLIAGVDEVGRGALAGPVVAAAVILPSEVNAPWLEEVKESKQLTPSRRELLFQHIQEVAISVGIGISDSELIDTQGIIRATRLAMLQAIEQLSPSPQCLLIDYMLLPESALPQKGIKGGDSRCFSIACASIMAKVTRDRLMTELDKVYPGYGLAEHKGYGTKEHLASLRRLGPSPIHRRSFQPIKDIIQKL
jgi:ribonuclease HII